MTRLPEFGRAFGLADAIDLARRGGYVPRVHDRALDAWAFELWTQRDRKTMPPVVVTLNGADLDVGRLADVLDGNAHLVLVVDRRFGAGARSFDSSRRARLSCKPRPSNG